MAGLAGGAGARQLGGRIAGAALEPDLVDLPAPARERRDGVRAREDVVAERVPGEPLEDVLAHLVGRLDVQLEAHDRAERAERDDVALEVLLTAADGDELAAGGHELQRGDGRGEVAVAVARAVRGGRDGARDRDVRQRGEVGERHALAGQLGRQRAVADAARHGDDAAPVVDADLRRERVEQHSSSESAIAVNEWRVPSTRMRSRPAASSRTSSTLPGRCRTRAP